MNVLFLSVSTGDGHLKAAEAIKEYVLQKYPLSRILIADTLKYISPVVDRLIVGGYLNTVKSTPHIYGKLYKLAEADENITDISKSLNKVLSHKLNNLINEFNPSIIVCTHTLPLQMLSYLKRKGKVTIPVVAIVTDFVNHLFWKLENIDAFVVAHEYIKHDMVNMGIPHENIYAYGIPVSQKFLHKKDKKNILESLKLENRLTALVMGGSLGFGEIPCVFKSLLNCDRDLQIIVVTGKNEKLHKQLESYLINNQKQVKILSYTNRIADLMNISDIIITKPGGMTISEALVKQLPIFIMSPIPGQEERNARFLVNSGVAVRILPDENINNIFYQVLDNPLRLKHMKEMASYLARPYAAKDIVGLMEELMSKSQLIVHSQ